MAKKITKSVKTVQQKSSVPKIKKPSPSTKPKLVPKVDSKGVTRCHWVSDDSVYLRYHDEEWGVPVHDDGKHFEFLILEGAQAGLSWITILKRREGYRKAFARFDPAKVAKFGEADVIRLMQDQGIIRNQLKIRAAISNAKHFLEIQKEFGTFDRYFWQWVDGKVIENRWREPGQIPPTSPESDALAKDMKKRGFKFAGSTIMYAHMQACGLVNDHLQQCFRYAQVGGKRK